MRPQEPGIRQQPCTFCPYRRDVPSGVWSVEEYAKLVAYDAPTFAQPLNAFACHASPAFLCHGWGVVHSERGHEYDLLALRLCPVPIPTPTVPLFASGTEAAAHGLRSMGRRSVKARRAIAQLLARYPRLRKSSAS